jgi:hypothetical protein
MPLKKGFLSRSPFCVSWSQQVVAASLLTTHGLFTNPLANGEYYEFLGADWSLDVLSTSGTLDLRVVPVSTAFTGGATLLATAANIDLNATARVARKASITTNRVTRQIKPGSMISMIFAGTLTSLVGLNVNVWLQAMRGIRTR